MAKRQGKRVPCNLDLWIESGWPGLEEGRGRCGWPAGTGPSAVAPRPGLRELADDLEEGPTGHGKANQGHQEIDEGTTILDRWLTVVRSDKGRGGAR